MNYKKFVPQEVLEKGFSVIKYLCIKTPVNNMLAGFCFEKIRTHLYVNLFFQLLFVKADCITLKYGWRLSGRHKQGSLFLVDEENIEYSYSEVKTLLSKEVDFVASIDTLEKFYNFFKTRARDDLRYYEGLVYTAFYLNAYDKEKMLNKFMQLWELSDRKELYWMKEMKEGIDTLVKLDGKEELMTFFNNNIEWTLNELKLTKLLR